MPVVRLRELLDEAYSGGYAIPAFNIIDELSMDAVLSSAAQQRSPVIVQVSVRTAKFWGPRLLQAGFETKTRLYGATSVLHLDHCHDPEFLLECLDYGWGSALLDTSDLPFEDGVYVTRQVVKQAETRGAEIEGEFERISRVGSSPPGADTMAAASLEDCVRFLETTGVSAFGPALGTQHGMHDGEPEIDYERAGQLSRRIPIVLHGGSGLSDECLRRVVGSGVSKINFSSVLKEHYADAIRVFATGAPVVEPLEPLRAAHGQLATLCGEYTSLLGSAGKTA